MSWWITVGRWSSTCRECGNEIPAEQPMAFKSRKHDAYALCQVCAEREGVWKTAQESKRYRQHLNGDPPPPPSGERRRNRHRLDRGRAGTRDARALAARQQWLTDAERDVVVDAYRRMRP